MHKINTFDNWLADADADAEDYGVTFSRPNLGIKPGGIRGFRIQLSPVSQTISSPKHRVHPALQCPAEAKGGRKDSASGAARCVIWGSDTSSDNRDAIQRQIYLR